LKRINMWCRGRRLHSWKEAAEGLGIAIVIGVVVGLFIGYFSTVSYKASVPVAALLCLAVWFFEMFPSIPARVTVALASIGLLMLMTDCTLVEGAVSVLAVGFSIVLLHRFCMRGINRDLKV